MSRSRGNLALNNTAPAAPQVYRLMRHRIVVGDLVPGARISESEIALAYGVSRQPVREAFIKLNDESLVEIRPQRGTYVSKISYASVLDARFVREAIEADIVKLLASKSDASLVRELRKQLELQVAAQSSPTEFIRCDEHFHQILADAAGQGRVWHYIEGLKTQMDRVRFLRLQQFPIELLIKQHCAVVDAIEAMDCAGSETAMRNHLREILQMLPEIFEANSSLFDGLES